jgi:hypothetical protein
MASETEFSYHNDFASKAWILYTLDQKELTDFSDLQACAQILERSPSTLHFLNT